MKLTEEIITQLGFGDYWGDSGDSGTRYLANPVDTNRSLMRIHDIDEVKAGSYYTWVVKEDIPQHYSTDDWADLNTLEELLQEAQSGKWPGAYELLMENVKKHNLL